MQLQEKLAAVAETFAPVTGYPGTSGLLKSSAVIDKIGANRPRFLCISM